MVASLTVTLLAAQLAAQIDVYPQDDFETIVENAQPGDEVIFHEGAYQTTGFWGPQLMGTADQPIIIRSAEGEAVSITGVSNQNLIDISGSYYELRGFELIGGSHGVRIGTSNNAVFEDLHIHDTGDVGISCNRTDNTYNRITIRGLHIHDTAGTGECMYLGCNDGACTMADSLVEFNWCHDTTNSSQGDGIELKTGSYGVTIRHNVIHDVKYPGITMYGTQGQAPNVVEGNIVWNVVDNGIQTVGDVMVSNNIVFSVGGNGIHAKPSQGEVPSDLMVVHNTVVGAGSACFRGNDWPGGNGNWVAANAFFCAGGTAVKLVNAGGGEWMNNGVLGALDGKDPSGTFELGTVDSELLDAASWHAYPSEGSSLTDAGGMGWAETDFNCLPRDGSPDAGAYEFMGADNPGWQPAEGFKTCADGGEPGDGDGDPGDGDGDPGDGDGDGDPATSGDGDGDEPGGSGEEGSGSGSSGDEDGQTGEEAGDSDETGGTGGESAGADEDGDSGCACSQREPSGRFGGGLLALGLLGLVRRRRA